MDIKKILNAVAFAFKSFRASFAFGKTTDELFEAFEGALRNELGEYEIVYDYIWGKDTLNIDGQTKGYTPRMGDTLIMDISVGKNGVWCDVCRTYFVGEPSLEQRESYALICESLRNGHRALKIGARACDVYTAVNKTFEGAGKSLVHHAGHAIGEAPLMQPQFLKENKTALGQGFYTVETGLYSSFGMRVENDFILSENGAEDLFEELLPLDIKEYILI